MRTLTTQLTACYANIYGAQSDRFVVEIYSTVTSAWVDYTNLFGHNWVESASYENNNDAQYETASIRFYTHMGDNYLASLSPLITTSQINTTYGTPIALHRRIRIRAGTTSAGAPVPDADLQVVFLGRIHDFGVEPDGIDVTCWDESGILAGRQIEEVITYSQAGTTQTEVVMQDILDDHYNEKLYRVGGSTPDAAGETIDLYDGAGLTTFVGALSPAWVQHLYKQQRQPILNALQVLADQVGWRIRWRWHNSLSAFQLTFEDVDRTTTTAALSIPHTRVISRGEYKESVEGIRNALIIQLQSSTGERVPHQSGTIYPNLENTTSIDAVGRRFMEVQEDSASQLDTGAEANIMGDIILGDLRHALEGWEIEIPYLFVVQLGDLIEVTADNVMHDTNVTAGVVGYKHSLTNQGSTTTLTLRGVVESAHMYQWTNRQADSSIRHVESDRFIVETSQGDNLVPNGDFGSYGRY